MAFAQIIKQSLKKRFKGGQKFCTLQLKVPKWPETKLVQLATDAYLVVSKVARNYVTLKSFVIESSQNQTLFSTSKHSFTSASQILKIDSLLQKQSQIKLKFLGCQNTSSSSQDIAINIEFSQSESVLDPFEMLWPRSESVKFELLSLQAVSRKEGNCKEHLKELRGRGSKWARCLNDID